MNSKIITSSVGGVKKTHFAYGKNDGISPFTEWKTYQVWVKALNHDTQVWTDTFVGYQKDNHGVPEMTIDSLGYMHIAYGPHGYETLRYRKSTNPNDSTAWGTEEQISYTRSAARITVDKYGQGVEHEGPTYPVMRVDSVGTVHIVCSGSDAVLYTRKPSGGAWAAWSELYWSTRHYCRYNISFNIGSDDNLHIITDDEVFEYWSSLPPSGEWYTIENESWYLKSTDNGVTWDAAVKIWELADGPVRNLGSLEFDENGNIHTIGWSSDGANHHKIYHIYHDGAAWNKVAIELAGKSLNEQAVLTIDPNGNLFIFTHAWDSPDVRLLPETRDNYLIHSPPPDVNYDYSYTVEKITEGGDYSPYLHWTKTMQRNARYAPLDGSSFYIMFDVGEAGTNTDTIVNDCYIAEIAYTGAPTLSAPTLTRTTNNIESASTITNYVAETDTVGAFYRDSTASTQGGTIKPDTLGQTIWLPMNDSLTQVGDDWTAVEAVIDTTPDSVVGIVGVERDGVWYWSVESDALEVRYPTFTTPGSYAVRAYEAYVEMHPAGVLGSFSIRAYDIVPDLVIDVGSFAIRAYEPSFGDIVELLASLIYMRGVDEILLSPADMYIYQLASDIIEQYPNETIVAYITPSFSAPTYEEKNVYVKTADHIELIIL